MEQVQASPRNWTGYSGFVRLDRLSDHCVIDRCAAEVGHLDFRTRLGGARSVGLRPRRPDPAILAQRATFFQALRADIAENGIKLPLLVWGINGKLYLRYGASRVHSGIALGLDRAPAILCQFSDGRVPEGFLTVRALSGPADVLDALGPLSSLGHFIVDHEMIDIHRAEPYGYDPLP